MNGATLRGIADCIPINRVMSDNNIRQLISQSLFGASYVDAPSAQWSMRDGAKRKRLIDDTIRNMTGANILSAVPGGFLRGIDRKGQVQMTFIFDNQMVTVNAADYEATVARMKQEKLNRSPQENTRRRLEQLEIEMATLKESLQ
jgi:hypothetical protein